MAGGARCRSVGFYSDALLCLSAPVPAGPSGEQPPTFGARPSLGAGLRAGHLSPVRGPGGQVWLWRVCAPRVRLPPPVDQGLGAEQALGARAGHCGGGHPRAFEAPQVTGRVRAVSV